MKRALPFTLVGLLVVAALLVAVFTSGSSTKVATVSGTWVPSGATALYSSYQIVLPEGGHTAYGEITNAADIEKVRELINALPKAKYKDVFCPADVMIPYVYYFSTGTRAASFARVSVQLGGCPTARVTTGGTTTEIGDWNLAAVNTSIQKIVWPNGPPLS